MRFGFEVGDRVQCIVDHPADNPTLMTGYTGTVVDLESNDNPPIGVEWDVRVIGGHTCNGHVDDGYGWYVYDREIELLSEEEIETATDDELSALLFGKEE